MAGWFISVIPRVTLVTGLVLVVSVLAFAALYGSPPLATGQSYSTYYFTSPTATSYETTMATTTFTYQGVLSGIQANQQFTLIQSCYYVHDAFTVADGTDVNFSITTNNPLLFMVMTPTQFSTFSSTGWNPACGASQALAVRPIASNIEYSMVWHPPAAGDYYWVLLNTGSNSANYFLAYSFAVSQVLTSILMETKASEESPSAVSSQVEATHSFTPTTSASSYMPNERWLIAVIVTSVGVMVYAYLQKRSKHQ